LANLLLIPTQPELIVLQPLLAEATQRFGWSIELCGFGPIAAAARTAEEIARSQPQRVLLLGIAGTYCRDQPDHAIGTAAVYEHVACYGVGVGTGDHHQAASELGWLQWQNGNSTRTIGDVISLGKSNARRLASGGYLLSCCAASDCEADVAERTRRHPEATAEDMEGFGVALACELAGVPLHIARGISNHAGDRNKDNWHIETALQAAAELALKIIAEE
jgi:futalosine hydrolase